ncbi:TerB-like protein [Tumebacillus sp. BK434]|uniref:TerB N-terminal domain-containing protein n=1 Tax=Tumebacillus sp. BK434 TaxID=2512169 RepID=UPI00104B5804|nr:TerB N-terminal domain-containing protein [Tumebacillus sp. BK434]TCP58079.1 TerB-like protein [Tumebacillus sp. BK434]
MKAKQFRAQVVRWKEEAGTPAPEVEFFHNWPKHEHLDTAQLRWFLYWRGLWEHGVVKKTSLSYMNLHIYELLSLEYINDPARAVERLTEFYAEFHSIQPKLDVTLVRWIGDLYLKLGDLNNALYWYTKGPNGDLYEKLSWYRYGEMDIPMALLLKVAGMTKTGFYRERMPGIEAEIEGMMQAAFRAYQQIEGMHPLDKYARWTDEPVIYLFSNTPIHEKCYLDGFRRYEYAGTFVHWVKNGLRCAENLIRRTAGKPLLKYDESVAVYFAELEPNYPPKPKPQPKARDKAADLPAPLMAHDLPEQPIELDFSRVQALAQETDWLVDMMQEEGANEELLLAPPKVEQKADGELLASLFTLPEAGELDDLFAALAQGEQDFLRHLTCSGETSRRMLSDWLKSRRMFLDAAVMSINEQAIDAGLEPILFDDGETVTLEAEHEDAMRRICNHE